MVPETARSRRALSTVPPRPLGAISACNSQGQPLLVPENPQGVFQSMQSDNKWQRFWLGAGVEIRGSVCLKAPFSESQEQ